MDIGGVLFINASKTYWTWVWVVCPDIYINVLHALMNGLRARPHAIRTYKILYRKDDL